MDMAGVGLYVDSGGLHVTNCFPARSLFRTPNRGAGHWLIAQRDAQDQRFRGVVCSASAEQKGRSDPRNITRSGPSHEPAGGPQCMLDAVFLMETHHLKKPSDLCAVDVSDRNLTSAKAEEFGQFTCVAYMNAAENTLALENFRTFPALRELDLSMNGIRRISVRAGDFPQLEVLNLSYNSLSPMDIVQLGVLSRLRVLYLSGNGLTHLPLDLSVSPRKDAGLTMFPYLEILMLDDNEFSHPAVFASLAGLRSLRVLNLDKNAISAVPYLHESPSREMAGGSSHRTQEAEGRGHAQDPSELAEEKLDYIILPNAKDTDRTEVIFSSTIGRRKYQPVLKPLGTTVGFSSLPSFLLSSTEQMSDPASPPLPNLRSLSLADNKVIHEGDLLAVALFPSLDELVIYGNPLTTLRKGDPPLLGNFLQQRLGIKIIRKKSTRHRKPHLIIPVREKRKVRTHVPKIPKQPLMLEPPLYPFLRLPQHESEFTESVMSSTPLPPIRTSSAGPCDAAREQSHESVRSSETLEREMSFGSDPTVESVFMTQVDNLDPVHNSSPPITPEEPDPASTAQGEIPERFRGYEELFDVKTDPDFIEPVGIQNNVRALEYALSHLLVYRDYTPRLDSVQKPHIPQESKFGREICRIPQMKHKKEVLSEIVTNMRERRHLEEVSLDSALREDKPSKEQKAAKQLLKELHKKYKFFHAEAVKRAAELEASLRQSAQELLEAQYKLGGIQSKTVQ